MDESITVELDHDTLRELNDRAERHGLSVGEEVGAIVREWCLMLLLLCWAPKQYLHALIVVLCLGSLG